MKGSLVHRGPKGSNRWALVVDLGSVPDPGTGKLKRRQKWVAFRGPKRGPGGAEAKLMELVRAISRDEFVAPSALTLGDWLTQWLAKISPNVRPATRKVYASIIRTHLTTSALGMMPLQKVRASDLEGHYASLTAAKATIRVHHTILDQALRMAARDRLLLSNPMTEIERRAYRGTDDNTDDVQLHCWNPTDVKTFLAAAKEAGPQAAALFAFALDAGARKGEILGLTWDCVKLDTARVDIKRQLAWTDHAATFAPTKTGKGRHFTVSAQTVALLRAHKGAQAAIKMANRTCYEDGGYVFAVEQRSASQALGNPLTPGAVDCLFARVTRAADVPRIKFHGLRHTCATLLLAAGVPVHQVQTRLGHSKPSLTLDVYGHAQREQEHAAASAIGTIFGS